MGERNEIFLLLFLGAKFVDVIAAERIVGGDEEADGAVDAGKFFDDGGVFDVAETGAAVFFGKDDAHEAHFRRVWGEVPWGSARLRPTP